MHVSDAYVREFRGQNVRPEKFPISGKNGKIVISVKNPKFIL